MKADLYVDESALNQAASNFMRAHDDLSSLKDKINNCVSGLKTDWNTNAGEAFFQKFEEELIHNLELYIDVFEHISTNLSDAVNTYSSVFDKADDLKNETYE